MLGPANIGSSIQLVVLDHHNYRSIIDPKHTLADTVAFFQPKLHHIDVKLVSRYLSAEEATRKSEISLLMANTVLDYFLRLNIYNSEVNVADLVDIAVQFQQMFELTLLPEDEERLHHVILEKCASFRSYFSEDALFSPQEEYRRLNDIFKNYSPNDTYYFNEIHINAGSKNFTVSISGNLSASGFLDPLVVSNLPSKSFNYYPTGLLNSTHLLAYLARIDLQMRLRGQKILLVLHNNVVVDNSQFSNIELLYISPEVDKYFQNNPDNCIKFPDEYGLKLWIKSHIINRLSKLKTLNNPSLLINSILCSYSTCITKLLHDPLYFQFNQLNLTSSNFMGNNTPASYLVNENIKITEDNHIVVNEAPDIYSARDDNFENVNKYNYNVKDVYFILSNLVSYKNSDVSRDYSFDAKEIMDFLVQKVHPFLMQRDFPFVGHFHRFLDEFIDEYARIGASEDSNEAGCAFSVSEKFHIGPLQEAARIEKTFISTLVQDGDKLASTSFPHIDSIEVANSDASFLRASARTLSNGTSLPLPTLDEYDMFTPKKRRSSTNSIPTIKKSKIIEIMKKDKLSFVNSAQGSVFSDDSDVTEDSFSSKIKQFKDREVSNGRKLTRNGDVKASDRENAIADENCEDEDEDEGVDCQEDEHDSEKENKHVDRNGNCLDQNLNKTVGVEEEILALENEDIEVEDHDNEIEMEEVQPEVKILASHMVLEVEPSRLEESSSSDSSKSPEDKQVMNSNKEEDKHDEEFTMTDPANATSRKPTSISLSDSQSSESSESDTENSTEKEEEETRPASNSKIPLSAFVEAAISPSQVAYPATAPVKTSSVAVAPSTQIKLPRTSLGSLSSLVPPKSTVESRNTPKSTPVNTKFKGKLDFSSDDSSSSEDSGSSDDSSDRRNVSQLAQVKVPSRTISRAVPRAVSKKSTSFTNPIDLKLPTVPTKSTSSTKNVSTNVAIPKLVSPLLKSALDVGMNGSSKLTSSSVLKHVSKPKEKKIIPSQLKSIDRRKYDSSSEDEMSDPINESSDESEKELFGTRPNIASTQTQRTQTQNSTQSQIQTQNAATSESPVRRPVSPLQFSFDRNSPSQKTLTPREKLFSSQSTPASAGRGRSTILSMKLKELEARHSSPQKKQIPKKGQKQTSQAKERQLSASDSDSSSEDSDDSIGF